MTDPRASPDRPVAGGPETGLICQLPKDQPSPAAPAQPRAQGSEAATADALPSPAGELSRTRPAPPSPAAVPTAWPPSAQGALAFLLGLATALLGLQVYQHSRWSSRPAELTRSSGPAYRVDLNRADHAELLQLPGLGESLAGRIEEYRHAHGKFRSVEELVNVHGIGPATLERIRDWVCVRATVADAEAQAPVITKKGSRASGTSRAAGSTASGAGQGGSKKEASPNGLFVDINRATRAELERLPGIKAAMSQRIIDERDKAPFKSVDDLTRVPGIKGRTLERLRPYITVEKSAERVATAD